MRKTGIALLMLTLTAIVSCSSEAVPEQAAPTPEQLIVGKWQFSDSPDMGMEFTASGHFSMSGMNGQARYHLADGTLIIQPAQSDETQRFKATVSANELTLTDVEESEPAVKTDAPPETLKLIRAK